MAREGWDKDIGKELELLCKEVAQDAVVEFEQIMMNMCKTIIDTSPIGVQETKGRYQGNWQIAEQMNGNLLENRFQDGAKGSLALLGVFRNAKKDKTMYIFNNLPQAAIIEYGGYPEPTKGTWNKELDPSDYEKRSKGGYSLQAPNGHVRIAVAKANAKLGKL